MDALALAKILMLISINRIAKLRNSASAEYF